MQPPGANEGKGAARDEESALRCGEPGAEQVRDKQARSLRDQEMG